MTVPQRIIDRVDQLVGRPDDLYILSIEWGWRRNNDEYEFSESRSLMRSTPDGKGHFIRELLEGELLPDVLGGMDPWEPNPEWIQET